MEVLLGFLGIVAAAISVGFLMKTKLWNNDEENKH